MRLFEYPKQLMNRLRSYFAGTQVVRTTKTTVYYVDGVRVRGLTAEEETQLEADMAKMHSMFNPARKE